MQDIDCIVIGRNCAEELAQTFASIKSASYGRGEITLIYVDRGSLDASLQVAEQAGAKVVSLKRSCSLKEAQTAGLAAGCSPLVQFLDGGSSIAPEWFAIATKGLHSDTAICFGKRHERFTTSAWAQVIEIEENAKLGSEALVRRGENFEKTEKKIIALDTPMLTRDSHMKGWEDWWLYCFLQGSELADRKGDAKDLLREECVQRGGSALILAILGIIFSIGSLWWLLLTMAAIYILIHPRALQVEAFKEKLKLSLHQAALYAWHRSFAVIPEFFGVLRCWLT